jgi:hypothetical protein
MGLARVTVLKVRRTGGRETTRLVLLTTATRTRIISADFFHWLSKVVRVKRIENQKARSSVTLSGLLLIIPAASYSPTQLPAQYHRLQEA